MAENDDKKALFEANIEDFLSVYEVLNPQGKASFEAQMGPILENTDPKTKAMYKSLMDSAKKGLSREEAIEQLKKSVDYGKTQEPGHN